MSWWVPIVVAFISIIPGVLAYLAARSVKTEVTTNHGKRLGEYVELLAEKADVLELKMETQHHELENRIDALAEDLRQHMHEEQAARLAAQQAIRAVVVPMGNSKKRRRASA